MADTPLSKPTSDKIPASQSASRQEQPTIDKRPFIAADVAFVGAAIAIAASGGGPLNTMQFFWVSACVIMGGVLLVLPWLFELRLQSEVRNAERDQLNWETVQQLSSAIASQQTQADELREQAEKCAETIEQQDRENKELAEQVTDIKAQLDRLDSFDKQLENLKSGVDALKPALEGISKTQSENTEKLSALANKTESTSPEIEALDKDTQELKDSVAKLKETLDALAGKLGDQSELKTQLDSALAPLRDQLGKLSQAKPAQPETKAPEAPKPLAKDPAPAPKPEEKAPPTPIAKPVEKAPENKPEPAAKPVEPEPAKEPFSPRQPETRPSMMEKAMSAVRAGEQSPAISRLITPIKPASQAEPEAPKNQPATQAPKPEIKQDTAIAPKQDTPAPKEDKPEAKTTEKAESSAAPKPATEKATPPAASKPEQPTPKPEAPQLDLNDDDNGAPALLKAVSASAKSKPPVTDKDAVLILNALVGIGNKPYVREKGKDTGQVMEFVEIGKWRYIVPNVNPGTEYELFLNDDKTSDAGSFKLTPGETKELTARF